MAEVPAVVEAGAVTVSEISDILSGLGIDLIDNLIYAFTHGEDEEGNEIVYNIGEDVHTIAESVGVAEHPWLTTPISEYSVTEGLLFMILLYLFLSSLVRKIREGFQWL